MCRPRRFDLALSSLARLGHRPQGSQGQHILAEVNRRLDGSDGRVSPIIVSGILENTKQPF